MSADRVHRIRRHYEPRISPHRETFDILDWSSRESQQTRFAVLLRVLRRECPPEQPPRLLDVGCGLTDLAGFLEAQRFPVCYLGADITPALLAEAHRRSPDRRVVAADVFAASPFRPRAFDACYCSGVFNLSLGNNDTFAVEALPRLLALASRFAVANFLHCRTARKYVHCHYFDPVVLGAAMTRLGLRVELIDDYLENDFTLVLRR